MLGVIWTISGPLMTNKIAKETKIKSQTPGMGVKLRHESWSFLADGTLLGIVFHVQ